MLKGSRATAVPEPELGKFAFMALYDIMTELKRSKWILMEEDERK